MTDVKVRPQGRFLNTCIHDLEAGATTDDRTGLPEVPQEDNGFAAKRLINLHDTPADIINTTECSAICHSGLIPYNEGNLVEEFTTRGVWFNWRIQQLIAVINRNLK
jgi:hypothetical protein